MYLFKQIKALNRQIEKLKGSEVSVGFVPTMGALHAGHVSLIEAALQKSDLVVCSIFINPTQFNDKKDLEKYPRTPGKDIEKLLSIGCHILFMPDQDEVYEEALPELPKLNFKGLDNRLEGEFRPGHFAGVANVVYRLLQIVRPDLLLMGQKDYQQVQIVQLMIEQTGLPVQLSVEPTMREANGLAMSSRNNRLSRKARAEASIIYQTLKWIRTNYKNYTIDYLRRAALEKLTLPGFQPEYLEIVDRKNMLPLQNDTSQSAVACTAVWVEGVRLIDNMLL